MYRIHLVLHISTFFPSLFPKIKQGNVRECVSFGLYWAPGCIANERFVSSCECHEASECVELVFFFLNKRTKVTCYCQELLFIREVQSSAHSRSTQNISVLSVCVAVFIVNVV